MRLNSDEAYPVNRPALPLLVHFPRLCCCVASPAEVGGISNHGGSLPFGRVTPYRAASWPRDGAALAGSQRLRPFGLRSLPRASAARSQQHLRPARLVRGRSSKLAAREHQGAQRDRDGLTAQAFGREDSARTIHCHSRSARPALLSGVSSRSSMMGSGVVLGRPG
jgi:hypothetical protein